MILQCPRCSHIITWEREEKPEGPGDCPCFRRNHLGAQRAPWNVLKEMPKVESRRARFVHVVDDTGTYELHYPYFTRKTKIADHVEQIKEAPKKNKTKKKK